ncbi:hypothetical protein SAMN05421827_101311 [Pedobacter terrae]|uniref:Uncharacterized protein n=1 Tax=Pedobacter terrae TaxID=405671 RepID=A0A1G7NDS2_9SPHI|nr:hypothetical protein [Pedobacter terrae]SDF72057.1 hypothetical protein SAMN05421827_101311 [Pedobacter terrae]
MDELDLQSFWELLPLKGLGPIQLLMDKAAIRPYDKILGKIIAEENENLEQRKQDFHDTVKQFSEFFNEEDLKIAIDALEETIGTERDDISHTYRESGISMEYKKDQLIEIFADDRAKLLHFKGIPIFSSEPVHLISEISKELNEIPLIKDEEVVFPHHHLFLFSFLTEQANGQYLKASKKNRSISWRNSPRTHAVDLADYHQLNLS